LTTTREEVGVGTEFKTRDGATMAHEMVVDFTVASENYDIGIGVTNGN
jgi:hypothetical protein